MGGVIARYALAKAEADGTPLPVTSLVSIDAPQQGATVDLDFQNFVKDKVDPPPASLLTKASKQLLVAHAWDAARSEHLGFFDELKALNGTGYPKKIPTIGVACSRNVPNPNAGATWIEIKAKSIGIPIVEKSFTVKNEWAQAGSLLPTASTNIEVSGGRPDWLKALALSSMLLVGPVYTELNTNIIRSSHPTFIPFMSALDLDAQGVSKFTIPIQQEETEASFHDRIPASVGRQIVDVLGVDITTIATNETFNFTALKGRFIRKSIQVNGRMGINKDLPSGSSLASTPEAKLNLPIQKLFTSNCSPITINVESGGSIDMSDNNGSNVFNSTFTLKSDDVVRIKNGASLKISKESSIIIGNGAKLIIDAGANINLVDIESKIIIKNGGELIINGDFAFSGNGYFSFENGNKLTLNTDWTLTGSGKNTRLINVENNAEIKIKNGRRWTIKEALVRKVGSVSGDVLLFENGSTLSAENVTFDDQVSGGSFSFVADYEAIDLDNSPNDMEFSFRNCNFGNTAYAVAIGGFDNGNRFDFRNLNVEFVNSTFTNCRQAAYYAEHGFITTFDNCTILGGGIEVERMYWLQMRNTTMRGGTIGANKIGVRLNFSIHNWIRENCLISGYATGIDALSGINGNIVLSDRTTIQSCGTAIRQNGGADFGLLYMDCTAILENQNGITGTDILLSAYSRGNTANIYRRPLNNSSSLFFNNTFNVRNETDIWLFGSYWDNPTYNASLQPPATSVNNFWRFMNGNNPWGGTVHLADFATIADVNNCGGVQLRDADDDSLARANAIVLVNGEYRNVRIQQNAALAQLRQNNLEDAINLFSPVAGIVNGVRDTANSAVRHFVDVARVMAQGQSSITTRSKSSRWLPETLVEIPKVISEWTLSPNPANDAVQLTIKSGNYHLRVSNAVGQTIFQQNTEGATSVNVATWANGIYLFELTDKATNKQQRSKIVVQH